jgi:hypothetical protein
MSEPLFTTSIIQYWNVYVFYTNTCRNISGTIHVLYEVNWFYGSYHMIYKVLHNNEYTCAPPLGGGGRGALCRGRACVFNDSLSHMSALVYGSSYKIYQIDTSGNDFGKCELWEYKLQDFAFVLHRELCQTDTTKNVNKLVFFGKGMQLWSRWGESLMSFGKIGS